MAEFRLAPKAEDDLEDIWLFGCGKWGQLQADKYAGELHAKFVALAAAAPAAGVPCDHIKPGYRRSFGGATTSTFGTSRTESTSCASCTVP